MLTREEKVAQIEAVLRTRFFPLVPKIENANRTDWNESRHDIDRLSRALAAYTLVGMCQLVDVDAVEAVTDGEHDGGIDAFYFDKANNRLLIVQAKYKITGASPSQDEVLKTINGLRKLLSRDYDSFNAAYQNRLDELDEAFDTVGISVVVVLAFLGEDVALHAQNDLNTFQKELQRFGTELRWQAATLQCFCNWLQEEQTPQPVFATLTLENWGRVDTPRTVYYGQVSAKELAALVIKEGAALFERNIRYYLGSSEVNEGIARTVNKSPEELFYLNNGLTAIAQRIQTSAGGNRDRCRIKMEGVSIVNGAQTAGAIATAENISPNAKLLLTVIEVGAGQEDVGVRITRARNSQNAVLSLDFAAADPNQERLRRELAAIHIAYHYRPSAEAYDRKEDAFNIEEAALALACLSFPVLSNDDIHTLKSQGKRVQNAVNFVVAARRQRSLLWDREGDEYKQLFTSSLSGIHLLRLVRIYRFVDAILADTAASETTYSRSSFFSHGRYLVMAFVAHQLPKVIHWPAPVLSAEEHTLLSQAVNEVSEEIYEHVQRTQVVRRGFRAFFRHLEYAQPLTDGIFEGRKRAGSAASLNKIAPTAAQNTTTEQS